MSIITRKITSSLCRILSQIFINFQVPCLPNYEHELTSPSSLKSCVPGNLLLVMAEAYFIVSSKHERHMVMSMGYSLPPENRVACHGMKYTTVCVILESYDNHNAISRCIGVLSCWLFCERHTQIHTQRETESKKREGSKKEEEEEEV